MRYDRRSKCPACGHAVAYHIGHYMRPYRGWSFATIPEIYPFIEPFGAKSTSREYARSCKTGEYVSAACRCPFFMHLFLHGDP